MIEMRDSDFLYSDWIWIRPFFEIRILIISPQGSHDQFITAGMSTNT